MKRKSKGLDIKEFTLILLWGVIMIAFGLFNF